MFSNRFIRSLLVWSVFMIYNLIASAERRENPDVGIVGIHIDAYKKDGELQDDLRKYDDCLEVCASTSDCLAVDFDYGLSACFFHNADTACGPASSARGLQHVQLVLCTSDSNRQGGELAVVAELIRPSIHDCVRLCKGAIVCVALDWDATSNTCWIHRENTACNPLLRAPKVVHISKVSCQGIPNALEVLHGYDLDGGRQALEYVSEETCANACATDPRCWAATFSYVNNGCFLHGNESGCLTRVPKTGTITRLYKPCKKPAARVTSVKEGVIRTLSGSVGAISAIGQTLQQCLDSCTPPCHAVNFRSSELQFNECWHIDGLVDSCVSSEEKSGYQSYRLVNCSNPMEVVSIHKNFHVRDGEFMTSYTSEEDCVAACRPPHCLAADFNSLERACFHHTIDTNSACNVLVTKEACNHYKFTYCDQVRKVVARFEQMRIRGTNPRIISADSSSYCLQACADDASCSAVDYTSAPHVTVNNCYLHNKEDACRNLTPETNWFNFRFTDCAQVFPGARNFTGKCGRNGRLLYGTMTREQCVRHCKAHFASSPSCHAVDYDSDTSRCYVHSPDTSCKPLVRSPACTHHRLTDCATEIFESHQSSYVPGGALVEGVTDAFNCVVTCYLLGDCVAIDFNTAKDLCYLHNATSGCSPMIRDFKAVNYIHYKFIDCPNSAPNIGETYFSHSAPGGVRVDGTYDANSCLKECFRNYPLCRAADFDFRDKRCWFHNSTTACSEPLPENNVIHYRMDDCETQERPLTVFGLNASQPYKLTGYRIQGGSQSSTKLNDAIQCMVVCENIPGCMAADWHATSQTCYYHTGEAACSPLVQAPNFIHLSLTHCDGYFTRVNQKIAGKTLSGGVVVGRTDNQEDCLLSCSGPCLAVTYEKGNGACVHHDVDTHCTDVIDKAGSHLFRTSSCDAFPDDEKPPYTAVYLNYKKWGGDTNISHTTEAECLKACVKDFRDCSAVDYQTNTRMCIIHINVDCGPLILDPGTIHYFVSGTCDPDITRVKAYNNFHKYGAHRLDIRVSEEDCINLCHPEGVSTAYGTFPPCYAADYDIVHAECWHHVEEDICEKPLAPLDWINHYQVLGTGQCIVCKCW